MSKREDIENGLVYSTGIGGVDSTGVQYPQMVLWNPLDSGVNLEIDRVTASSTPPGKVIIALCKAPFGEEISECFNLKTGMPGSPETKFTGLADVETHNDGDVGMIDTNTDNFTEGDLPVITPGHGITLIGAQEGSRLVANIDFLKRKNS